MGVLCGVRGVIKSLRATLPRFFTGDFNFRELTARRLYKSFGVKGLMDNEF
jgi:hypothetical protein